MRLAAADRTNGPSAHRDTWRLIFVKENRAAHLIEDVALRVGGCAGVLIRDHRVSVGRDLLHRQRHRFCAARFCQSKTISLVDRNASTEIGEREGALSIAAVGGA